MRQSSSKGRNATAAARVLDEAGYSLAEMLVVVAVTGFLMASVFTIYEVTQRTSFRASGSEAALVQARAVVDKFGGDFRMVGAAWNYYSSSIIEASGTSITFYGDIDNTLDSSYNPVTLAGTGITAGGQTSMTVSDATNISCGTKITLANGPISETHTLAASGCKSGTTIYFQTNDVPFTYYTAGTLWATTGSLDVTFIYTVESVNWVYDATTKKLCRKLNATCDANAANWNDDSDVIADNVESFCLAYYNYTDTLLNANCGSVAASDLASIRLVKISVTVKAQAGDQTVTRQMELSARARALVP